MSSQPPPSATPPQPPPPPPQPPAQPPVPPTPTSAKDASSSANEAENEKTRHRSNTSDDGNDGDYGSKVDQLKKMFDDNEAARRDQQQQQVAAAASSSGDASASASASASADGQSRLVSWGENKNFFFNKSKEDQEALDSQQQQQGDESDNAYLQRMQRQRIQLEDVKRRTPEESEAESYILQALDQSDSKARREREEASANSGEHHHQAQSSVMPYLPDEAVQNMLDESLQKQGSVERATSAASDNNSVSHRSTSMRSASRSSRAVEAKPPRRWSQVQENVRRRKHANASAEEKLFGLVSAFGAMHSKTALEGYGPDPAATAAAASDNNAASSAPLSSGEALLNHANLLYEHTTAGTANSNAIAEEDSESDSSDDDEDDEEQGQSTPMVPNANGGSGAAGNNANQQQAKHKKQGKKGKKAGGLRSSIGGVFRKAVKKEAVAFNQFKDSFSPIAQRKFAWIRNIIIYMLLPCLAVGIALFYFADNPPTGVIDAANPGGKKLTDEEEDKGEERLRDGRVSQASASWWLLFLGVRQVVTFLMAHVFQLIFIDILSMRSRVGMRYMGPWITLFVMQSRGWPFILAVWGFLDLLLLTGRDPFSRHWLFWQDEFGVFNSQNPSGGVVESTWNYRIVLITLVFGVAVSVKRFVMGLFLGRRTFEKYSAKLSKIMGKILLIGEVGALAMKFYRDAQVSPDHQIMLPGVLQSGNAKLDKLIAGENMDDPSTNNRGDMAPRFEDESENPNGRVFDPDDRNPITGQLNPQQKSRIADLLGAWEEPVSVGEQEESVSITAILQFRRAVALLDTDYPFSGAFGPAGNRVDMIESAQEVYDRLMLHNPTSEERLAFEVMASICLTKRKDLDQIKAKELIRLFRPDRDGKINVIDFVKSVDRVYRDVRMLRASVKNSAKMDKAFESMMNVMFYGLFGLGVIIALGVDAEDLFLTFSGVILSFAFMISAASSKYFEGLTFILRDPYSIGDGIHVSSVESDTASTGSPWWRVEDVTLATTTVVSLFTNERAMLYNASLANSRIINVSRSHPAGLHIFLKLPIDTAYDKIESLRKALESYIKRRPREWLSFNAFRPTQVDAERGFVEYIVAFTHRETWESFGALMTSRSHVMGFALEVLKKMSIRYVAPPMPVDVTMVSAQSSAHRFRNEDDAAGDGGASVDNEILENMPGLEPNETRSASSRRTRSQDFTSLEALFSPSVQVQVEED